MGGRSLKDIEAYIHSSKYRLATVEFLVLSGAATPTEIAEGTNKPRPHISRALSELQEKDAVELAVPEGRSVGRYYDLTDLGRQVWENSEESVSSVNWTIKNPTTETEREIVDVAKERFDDDLRFIVKYDTQKITLLYADPDIMSDYSDEEFKRGLRGHTIEHAIERVNTTTQPTWAQIFHFEELTMLRINTDQSSQYSITFDAECDIKAPSLPSRFANILQPE